MGPQSYRRSTRRPGFCTPDLKVNEGHSWNREIVQWQRDAKQFLCLQSEMVTMCTTSLSASALIFLRFERVMTVAACSRLIYRIFYFGLRSSKFFEHRKLFLFIYFAFCLKCSFRRPLDSAAWEGHTLLRHCIAGSSQTKTLLRAVANFRLRM